VGHMHRPSRVPVWGQQNLAEDGRSWVCVQAPGCVLRLAATTALAKQPTALGKAEGMASVAATVRGFSRQA
jgi:hypothetical protein